MLGLAFAEQAFSCGTKISMPEFAKSSLGLTPETKDNESKCFCFVT